MRRVAVLAVAVALLASTVSAAADFSLPIRIGMVAFDKCEKCDDAQQREAQRQNLNALGDDGQSVSYYLRALAEESHLVPMPRFQIYRGNYYQVMAWLENGDIDGAILSPFMAMRATATPETKIVASFAYTEQAAKTGWTTPYIAASIDGVEQRDPDGSYRKFIEELVDKAHHIRHVRAAGKSGHEHKTKSAKPPKYAVVLVSHLSTSGFIVPLMYTHELFHKVVDARGAKLGDMPQQELAARFWDHYFRYVHLTFWHKGVEKGDQSIPAAATAFSFTYEDSGPRDHLQYAVPYMRVEGIDPNDVLVLRARVGAPAYKTIQALQALQPQNAADRANQWIKDYTGAKETEFRAAHPSPSDKFKPHWYQKVVLDGVMSDMQEKFNAYAKRLFLNGSDVCAKAIHDDRFVKWYEHGKYDFSAPEIIALLSHDQLIRDVETWHRGDASALRTDDLSRQPAAALVLPGGGVRGTYQAALLDDLYDHEKLINFEEAKSRNVAPRDGTLILRHVIGTSGGALVGFFAAQRAYGQHIDQASLRQEWIKGDDIVATPQRIFPPVALLRWISALVIVMLFALVARVTFGRRDSAALPSGRLSPIIVFGIGVALVLAPFVLWRLDRETSSYTPTFEGFFYFVLLLIGHAILTVTACPTKHLRGKWKQNLLATFMAVAAVTVIVFILVRPGWFGSLAKQRADVGRGEVSGQSLIAFVALLTILLAVAVYARTHDLVVRAALKAYARGLAVIALLLTIAGAFFKIGTSIEATSTIEMTVEYWIWIGSSAIAAAALLTGIGKITEGTFICDAVTFWNDEHPRRRFLTTPAQSLLSFGVAALVLWAVFAAPALYNSKEGFETFNESAGRWREKHKFLANFVATMSSLGTVPVAPRGHPEYRGDFYVCREEKACSLFHDVHPERAFEYLMNGQDKQTRQKQEDAFIQAVFASGSPFPIYPSRRLSLPKGYDGMFMDGGYTHNTPIEAAHLLNAQQVLIVHSAQRIDPAQSAPPDRTVSALAGDSATLFSFMFDRSQTLDQAVRANMFVASLAPYGGHGADAFLMDFRPSTVADLRDAADDDYENHRIGQVDSWGVPTRLLYDTATEQSEP